MRKTTKSNLILFAIMPFIVSCSFLDIVPDSIATIEDAFTTRNQAEKYLFTCYSFMPNHGSVGADPSILCTDEYALNRDTDLSAAPWKFVHGEQSASGTPMYACWGSMWQAVSTCNIFLENIHIVPGMAEEERNRWIAEVKFLKAYYHFYAIRMYGPVPIKDYNIPVGSSPEEVKVYRDYLDDCFSYVINLLDEIIKSNALPNEILDTQREMGRITQEIAYALKAYVYVYWASPLYNGNTDYVEYRDNLNREIFNPVKTEEEKVLRWKEAAKACKEAIDFSEGLGRKLYRMDRTAISSDDETFAEVSLRSAFNEPWNSEIIWANSNTAMKNLQGYSVPRGLSEYSVNAVQWRGIQEVNLKMAELFYSENGVPIEEDLSWDYSRKNEVVRIPSSYDNRLISGYETVRLHLNRENRFYASLGFDGARWYAYNKTEEERSNVKELENGKNKHYVVCWRYDGHCFTPTIGSMNHTGYVPKKLVNYKSNLESTISSGAVAYPFPLIRLTDLYLLYAEALNEAGEDLETVMEYVDLVRERAGLGGVVECWSNFSTNPQKYMTQSGRREIIQRERTIELMFEGKRFWDLRRWKKLVVEMNKPMRGWSIMESDPNLYYKETAIYKPTFGVKDYFFPIAKSEILDNRNLIQNYGW